MLLAVTLSSEQDWVEQGPKPLLEGATNPVNNAGAVQALIEQLQPDRLQPPVAVAVQNSGSS